MVDKTRSAGASVWRWLLPAYIAWTFRDGAAMTHYVGLAVIAAWIGGRCAEEFTEPMGYKPAFTAGVFGAVCVFIVGGMSAFLFGWFVSTGLDLFGF